MRKLISTSSLYCIAFLILCSISAHAQPPIKWQKCLGGTKDERALYAEQNGDSSYILAAVTNSSDGDVTSLHDSGDIWIIKLSPTGSIIWQKTYGGNRDDVGTCVKPVSGGGYIVLGATTSNNGDVSYNHGSYDVWVLRLDDTGKILWQKTYGGSNWDYAYYIQQTTDGGFIFAGYTESTDGDITFSHGFRDCWVVKLDDTGKITWQKTYGGSLYDWANSIQQTSDGGYILAGGTMSTDGQVTSSHGASDAWILKLNDTGAITWQKTIGGSGDEDITVIKQTFDHNYMMAGMTNSTNGQVTGLHGTAPDIWVVNMNDTGAIIWQKCYGGSRFELCSSLSITKDSGCIITGLTESNDGDVTDSLGIQDAWLLKLKSNGSIGWQKSLGGTAADEGGWAIQTKIWATCFSPQQLLITLTFQAITVQNKISGS